MFPLALQGIICHDEVLTRFLRKMGIVALIKDNINTAIVKGRTFGAFADVRLFSFVSDNIYISRLMDILLLGVAIFLFCYFIYVLEKNKYFSVFLGIMLMCCLPVAFEHGASNAFVAITVIPLIFLICSLLLFYSYLQSGKRYQLVLSMIIYVIVMMQYEFLVTYVLLYIFLSFRYCLNRNDNKKIKNLIAKSFFPVFLTFIYIVFYFVVQKINPSNYAGNTIGFRSLSQIFNVLYVLAKSSMPGYFLTNEKYQYLQEIYSSNITNNERIYYQILVIILIFSFLQHQIQYQYYIKIRFPNPFLLGCL